MGRLEHSPIDKAIKLISKKWTLNIIRDMFCGKKQFNEFLRSHPKLSSKVLSDKLRQLGQDELIEKRITSKTPLCIEYHLTSKGRNLNRVLYELSGFVYNECVDESALECTEQSSELTKKILNIID
ncbi:MAG: transcriptional regulator [Methanococcoides sp.]|jgi:DNA-binding HxlR family transcriptional regulator|uniref:Helix-turn-helix transcriptional regulator n=1 Tax=Methanococcoides seepicolus TaxID=2828780 RepID=A0A9E4ZF94_9EURY|nr:helix-turn-helix domain-containing protein [Methanococcoides seepicolus]MCM1986506.1 helix-turn-helix transcriptional regulator [Methanococcoides seepicolus]NOQ47643.1 transcriptional regulator [Methanococcoides sp.]